MFTKILGLGSALICMQVAFITPAVAQTKIDLASSYPADNFHVVNLEYFAKEVSNATNGQLIVQVHPNGTLVKPAEARKAVTDGKIAAAEMFGPSLASTDMVFSLDAIPFLATTYPSALKLWKATENIVVAKLAKQGLTLLMSVPWPPQGLFSSKPLNSTKDLEGLTMRENSPPLKRFAEVIGSKPISVETPELANAAKSGKLNLVFTSAAQGLDTKLYEHLPYFYQANAWLPRNLVVINTKFFDALPREQQLTLIKVAGKAEERGWMMSEQFAQSSTIALAKAGAKVAPLPASFRNRLERSGNLLAGDIVKQGDPTLTTLMMSIVLN